MQIEGATALVTGGGSGLGAAAARDLVSRGAYPPRLGAPEEFAKLVISMIENDYRNGEIVRLDGALRMQPK